MARRKGGKRGGGRGPKARPPIFRRARPAPRRKVLAPSSPFARVAPPPTHVPEGTIPDWDAVGRGRGGRRGGRGGLGAVPGPIDWDRIDEISRQGVFDELLRLDVDPEIAAELSRVDPNGWYVVTAVVRGGSPDRGALGTSGPAHEATNTVVLVGRGAQLWGRFLNLCDPEGGGSILVAVDVRELHPGHVENAFPLWAGQQVSTVDGQIVEGAGERAAWEASRVARRPGRRAKPSGVAGMTSAQRRDRVKRTNAAVRRHKSTKARVEAMIASGDAAGAVKLRRRSDAAKRIKRGRGPRKPRK